MKNSIDIDKDNRFLLPFVDEYITEITDDSIIINEIEGIR